MEEQKKYTSVAEALRDAYASQQSEKKDKEKDDAK